MDNPTPRPGRPRNYDLHPIIGFADQEVAFAAAALDELSERLFDLIADLPQAALDHIPEGTTNSIAMLVVHVAWAEASWISRATGHPIPGDLEVCLLPGRQDASGDLALSSASVAQLIAYCRSVRDAVTRPALASTEEMDVQLETTGQLESLRQVLMHVIWHWIYHSGQVGLLRRLWGGTRYKWTFDQGHKDAPEPSR